MVRIATQNMSNAEFAATLSTTALTEAERLQLISGRLLTDEELDKALATNIASDANVKATATTFSLTNAYNKLRLSIRGVGVAAMSNPITSIITVALTVITIVSQIKSHIKQAVAEAKQKAEEAASAIQQVNETFKKTSETTEQIGERFAELSQGVDSFTGKNKSLTSDEYAEFLNLSNQLAELFPTLTRNYDENGNAIVSLSGDVDTIVGSLENLVEVQRQLSNQEIVDNLPDLYKGILRKSNKYKIQIENIQSDIKAAQNGIAFINGAYSELHDSVVKDRFDNTGTRFNTDVLHIYRSSQEEREKAYTKYEDLLDELKLNYKEVKDFDTLDYDIAFAVDWTGMSDEQIAVAKKKISNGFNIIKRQYNEEIDGFQRELSVVINRNKANWSGLTQGLFAWLQTDVSYQALSDEMRVVVQKAINGIDFSEMSFNNMDNVINYIQTTIINPIAQAAPEVQEALRGLFDIDFATATLSDYFNAIKPYLTAIATALGKTEEEIAEMFGLTDQMTNFNALEQKRNELLKNHTTYNVGEIDDFQDWLDSLSAGDLEIVYKISTEYTSEKVKEQLEAYQDGGKVNLFLRPKVDNSELKKAGWDVSDNGYATVFTGTYSNTAGTIAANFTPILTDEDGNYEGVLSPDEFTRYCEDVLDGVREDDLKLQIGATFDGENAIEEADKAAGEIHILQDYLYDLGDPTNFNLDKWAHVLKQFKSAAAEPLDAFNNLLNDKGTAKDPHFIDRVDNYLEKVNKLDDAFKKISEDKFEPDDFNKLIRDFPTLATRSDDLTVAINELKAAMSEDMKADFDKQFDQMDTEESVAALEALMDSVLNVGKAVDETTSLFTGDSGKTQKILSEASKVQTILNSQKNGQSISLENFNSEEFKDYKEALEYVNGAMQLNEEKVVEITKAKAKERIAINKTNKAMAQEKYAENTKQIKEYRHQLQRTIQTRDKLELQSKIDDLLEENARLADVCAEYDLLSVALEEATSSYQHWLNTTNATDYGDMMSDTENAIKLISDTLDETSDIYGQFGSKKYQAALDLIIPDSVDRDSITAVKQYMANLKKYFYFDEDGAIAGMDIQGFIQKALNAGLMVFDSAKQEYKIAGGKTMESFAEGLKLSFGMVQAFFDEMQLYGGKFDWGDEAVKTLGDLAIKAAEAGEALREIPGFETSTLRVDFSDGGNLEEQIELIEEAIATADKLRAQQDNDSPAFEYLTTILEYYLRQKQALEDPVIMSVDATQVDEKYREAITLAQEYQNTINDKEVRTRLGLDTSSSDKKLTEIVQKIQGLNPKIKAELNLDTTSKDGIVEFIKTFDPNKYPKIVSFKANTEEVDKASEEVSKTINREVKYYASGLNSLPGSFPKITRKVHYEADGDTDVGELNGTAHASGTAKIGGDWGTAKGGKTLVGELGREYFASIYSDVYFEFI